MNEDVLFLSITKKIKNKKLLHLIDGFDVDEINIYGLIPTHSEI